MPKSDEQAEREWRQRVERRKNPQAGDWDVLRRRGHHAEADLIDGCFSVLFFPLTWWRDRVRNQNEDDNPSP